MRTTCSEALASRLASAPHAIMTGTVIGVACDGEHRFGKVPQARIRLIAELGVEGDAHAGATVRHRSRRKKTPEAPNLRQVHLIHAELFDELAAKGFAIQPGAMGENVTTSGLDLLGLPRGAKLRLGNVAVVEVTGLRNPCWQIDANIGEGGMAATLARAPDGGIVRKAGVMAIVLTGGEVTPGDAVEVIELPSAWLPLEPV
jgi:MOSC domain-containing protein YiiM